MLATDVCDVCDVLDIWPLCYGLFDVKDVVMSTVYHKTPSVNRALSQNAVHHTRVHTRALTPWTDARTRGDVMDLHVTPWTCVVCVVCVMSWTCVFMCEIADSHTQREADRVRGSQPGPSQGKAGPRRMKQVGKHGVGSSESRLGRRNSTHQLSKQWCQE